MERDSYRELRAAFGRLPVGRLIELLGSDSLPVRYAAEMCLRDAAST